MADARRATVCSGLAITASVLVVFGDAVFRGRVFFERDVQAYWYPHVAALVRAVAAGRPPLWNPYEGFGQPFLADPSTQFAYPPTWLNLLLLPATAYSVLVAGHVLFAGLGAARLARRWGISRLGATVAGIAWAASGPLLSAGTLSHHLMGASWIPWVVVAAEGVWRRPTRRGAALLALTAAGQALAGSAEMCVMSGLAVAMRVAAGLLEGRRRRLPRRAALPLAVAGATALVVAGAIAAVQWLPTAAVLAASHRGRFAPGENLYWSVHPLSFLEMVVPALFEALPLGPERRELLYSGREPFLPNLYLGLVPLLVAIGGPAGRRRVAWRALALALVFLLLALGRHFLPASWVLTTFPLRLFRYPVKYMIPAALFAAVFFGSAVDGWRRAVRTGARTRGRIAALLAGAFAAAALAVHVAAPASVAAWFGARPALADWNAHLVRAMLDRQAALAAVTALVMLVLGARRAGARFGARATRLAPALLAALAALDLVSAAPAVNSLAPRELLERVPEAAKALLPTRDHLRLLAVDDSMAWLNDHFVLGVHGWREEWTFALGLQDRVAPPMGARWGLRGSYDANFTGLGDPERTLAGATLLHVQDTPFAVRLLQVGNVGHVVTVQHRFAPLSSVAEFPTVFDRPVRVLRVPDPLPPAFVVGGARVARDPEETLRLLVSPELDPRREAVLASGDARPVPSGFQGAASLTTRDPDRLVVETNATHDAVLVVVEAYADGWRAAVDGRAVPVRRANALFRAVEVPAGRHTVELVYRPRSVTWGLVLGALGLVSAAALAARRA
jgi:hypothetical protein